MRKDPAQLLRHQAEPPQAAESLLRQRAAGDHVLPARGDGAGHPHQRGTDASGRHGADRRKDHPRQPGRGRRDPEKEPDHCICRPGGNAGACQPPPLPCPQPARHRCADPRRGRGRADEPAVKRFLLRNGSASLCHS